MAETFYVMKIAVGLIAHVTPVCVMTGLAQGLSLEARQPSEPLPQRAGSGQIEGAEVGAGGDMPSASGSVQEAARQALAMAERHRMQAAGEQPQLDGEASSIACMHNEDTQAHALVVPVDVSCQGPFA